MKRISKICIVLLAIVTWHGIAEAYASYDYDNQIESYWDLSEKASTLDKKSFYLDGFVSTIRSAGLSGNDALFFKTPNNSYDQNLVTLESLQTRMHEIQYMDVKSFEYQQAISQITAQEQGEAGNMLSVFEGIWYRQKHLFLWDWIDVVRWILEIVASIVFGLIWLKIKLDM